MSLVLNGTDGLSDVDGSAATPAIRGTDANTGIFFPAADTIAFAEGGAEVMRIDSSGNVGIGTSSPSYPLDVAGIARSNAWIGRTNGSAPTADCAVYRPADNSLGFSTANTERARIDSSGRLLVGTTSSFASNAFIQVNTYQNGAPVVGLATKPSTNANYDAADFFNSSGSYVGYIACTSSATSYVTSSDYRLKENIEPMTGALDKVALLKPCNYTWKIDGSAGQGFIAHELQAVVPDAVVGEKDAVNEDGSIKSQGIDTSFLVATLTAAIQEQQAIILAQESALTALTARVAALEGK